MVEEKTDAVAIVQKETSKAVAQAQELEVKDDAGYEAATGLLGLIKKAAKFAKEAKDKVLAPILQAAKEQRALWAPIEAQAEEAERIVKGKMLVFVNAREEAAKVEEAKLAARVDKGTLKPETAVAKMAALDAAPQQVSTATGVSQVRKIPKVYVVDEALVPDAYWELNMVLVRRNALGYKDPVTGEPVPPVEIPGVEVRMENSIAGQ